MLKLAAALLAGLIIGYSSLLTYRSLKYDTVSARASIEVINLPDGSTVTLNIGSSLSWLKEFKDEVREVKLDGEAFFEVSHDSLKPFIARSEDIKIEVLGTSFNIESDKKNGTSVIVEEGRVAVYRDKQRETAEYISEGEKVTWVPGSESLLRSVNSDQNFSAWKTRRIVFSNSTMQEVALTLSKVYNRDIRASTYTGGETITVIFEDNDLSYVLSTIKATLDVKIDETKSIITIK